MSDLFFKIHERRARVAVVGLGAVGLPLCVEVVKAGFPVFGIDHCREKISNLSRGQGLPSSPPPGEFLSWLQEKKLCLKNDFSNLGACDVICLAVPTPLTPQKEPDLGFVYSALTEIRKHLKPGHALFIESTLYPGATEEAIKPFLEFSGLKAGRDFFLAVSPERLDPGNTRFSLREIPKLVAGDDSASTEAGLCFYKTFVREVISLSSTRTAETAKCFENAFRFVNIALANELLLAARTLKVDAWEALEAAATKPFGFMPFSPGPGVGGASLPAASHFLRWKMKEENSQGGKTGSRLIEAAEKVHGSMAVKLVQTLEEGLKQRGKSLKGAKLLLLGVSYKENLPDLRHSPALRLLTLLLERGADLSYSDPHVPRLQAAGREWTSLQNPDLTAFDAIALLTPHDAFDLSQVARNARLLIDARNAARAFPEYRHKILRLGD